MNWTDRGLVVGLRPHGEGAAVLELMTAEHGRHLGLVHGGRSARLRPVFQPGNEVQATWRARLDEQLGTFAVEPLAFRAGRLLGSPAALYGLGTLAAHLRLLPERDPHPGLFRAASTVADLLDDPVRGAAALVRFELTLLAELGFGLDLTRCAATGESSDLAYVSPRSGRAVSRGAGEPYRARLLPLPGFLLDPDLDARPGETAAGFRLTAFFLDAHVWGPHGRAPAEERGRFVALAGAGGPDGSGNVAAPARATGDSIENGSA